MIFENIDNKLNAIPANSKVLVLCGAGHFYEQKQRFLNNGFEPLKIQKKVTYFESQDLDFNYPVSVEEVWEKHAFFYAYTYPDLVGQDNTLAEDIKSEFTMGDHNAFYQQQLEYNAIFSKNELYR